MNVCSPTMNIRYGHLLQFKFGKYVTNVELRNKAIQRSSRKSKTWKRLWQKLQSSFLNQPQYKHWDRDIYQSLPCGRKSLRRPCITCRCPASCRQLTACSRWDMAVGVSDIINDNIHNVRSVQICIRIWNKKSG